MKRSGFTLVEMLVVLGLIGITSTFGIMSYIRLQERQRVENTAKDIITYLRGIESKARNGDRGTGNCLQNASGVSSATMGKRLTKWSTDLRENTLSSNPFCVTTNNAGAITGYFSGSSVPFDNQKFTGGGTTLTLYCCLRNNDSDTTCNDKCNSKYLCFAPVFGNTQASTVSDTRIRCGNSDTSLKKNVKFVLSDESHGYHYQWKLKNGSLTSGCFCSGDRSSCNDDC